jgi:hypothetical protein
LPKPARKTERAIAARLIVFEYELIVSEPGTHALPVLMVQIGGNLKSAQWA